MEIVPLIYVKNKKIIGGMESKIISLADLLDTTDEKIYLKDIDGIEKNKPNLNLYQKLSETRKLWIDAGPRVLGDIVDLVMAGGGSLTIQMDLFASKDVSAVKEVTECDVYIGIREEQLERDFSPLSLDDMTGAVVYANKNTEHIDFYADAVKGFLKRCKKRVYVAGATEKTATYWKELGAYGLIVELEAMRKKGMEYKWKKRK